MDNGAPQLSSTTRVVVQVEDVNDHSPEFDQKLYKVQIPANAKPDQALFQVSVVILLILSPVPSIHSLFHRLLLPADFYITSYFLTQSNYRYMVYLIGMPIMTNLPTEERVRTPEYESTKNIIIIANVCSLAHSLSPGLSLRSPPLLSRCRTPTLKARIATFLISSSTVHEIILVIFHKQARFSTNPHLPTYRASLISTKRSTPSSHVHQVATYLHSIALPHSLYRQKKSTHIPTHVAKLISPQVLIRPSLPQCFVRDGFPHRILMSPYTLRETPRWRPICSDMVRGRSWWHKFNFKRWLTHFA